MKDPKKFSNLDPPATGHNAAIDRARAENAIKTFLEALGQNPNSPELSQTPARVVEAWAGALLAGYAVDPKTALGQTFPTDSRAAVTMRDIPFYSTCPHHLLPLIGHAHIAMSPNGTVAGFGGIAKLVDALAHRLVLQEELTQSIADSLLEILSLDAVVCVLEARHSCVAVTDPVRQNAIFRTTAKAGDPKQAELLLLEVGTPPPEE